MSRRRSAAGPLDDLAPTVRQSVAQSLETLPKLARVHPDRALLIGELIQDWWPVRPPQDRLRRQARVIALATHKKIAS